MLHLQTVCSVWNSSHTLSYFTAALEIHTLRVILLLVTCTSPGKQSSWLSPIESGIIIHNHASIFDVRPVESQQYKTSEIIFQNMNTNLQASDSVHMSHHSCPASGSNPAHFVCSQIPNLETYRQFQANFHASNYMSQYYQRTKSVERPGDILNIKSQLTS